RSVSSLIIAQVLGACRTPRFKRQLDPNQGTCARRAARLCDLACWLHKGRPATRTVHHAEPDFPPSFGKPHGILIFFLEVVLLFMTRFKGSDLLALGFMTFALFLGAGNIIFPASAGMASGEHVWKAALGFLLTGVGLPLLTVVALARVGGG